MGFAAKRESTYSSRHMASGGDATFLLRRITKVITFDGVSRPVTQEGLDYFSIREQIDNVVYFTPDAIKKESS